MLCLIGVMSCGRLIFLSKDQSNRRLHYAMYELMLLLWLSSPRSCSKAKVSKRMTFLQAKTKWLYLTLQHECAIYQWVCIHCSIHLATVANLLKYSFFDIISTSISQIRVSTALYWRRWIYVFHPPSCLDSLHAYTRYLNFITINL